MGEENSLGRPQRGRQEMEQGPHNAGSVGARSRSTGAGHSGLKGEGPVLFLVLCQEFRANWEVKGSSLQGHSHFDIICKLGDPQNHLGSIIHWKQSQNTLKTIKCMVMVYNRERTVSSAEGRSLCDDTDYCQPKPLVSRVFTGA